MVVDHSFCPYATFPKSNDGMLCSTGHATEPEGILGVAWLAEGTPLREGEGGGEPRANSVLAGGQSVKNDAGRRSDIPFIKFGASDRPECR